MLTVGARHRDVARLNEHRSALYAMMEDLPTVRGSEYHWLQFTVDGLVSGGPAGLAGKRRLVQVGQGANNRNGMTS